MNYQFLIELIEKNRDVANFGEFGNGVSDQWIDKAQTRLGVKFPPSYIWWLKNYSGGAVLGDEIYSIYEIDFDEVVGGDIVYMNELDRKNRLLGENQLSIQSNDQGETYFLDLNKKNGEGEYPVYNLLTGEKYADNFLDFLVKQIQDASD